MTTPSLSYYPEPKLRFAHEQAVEDPRDGLTLFGPLDPGRPYGIRVGVIGTAQGIQLTRAWLARAQRRLIDSGAPVARPPFLGFETVFRVPLSPEPVAEIVVPHAELMRTVSLDDRHQRVFNTVELFSSPLAGYAQIEEIPVDLWFVAIPDLVRQRCRPLSNVPVAERVKVARRLSPRTGRRYRKEPSLFDEDNALAVAYQYDVDFRNQLKARLLQDGVLTQIVQESTLASANPQLAESLDLPDKRDFAAAIAWNLSTAAYYKAGGRPWKLDRVRDGVCYVGLVFKQDVTDPNPRNACCAAQMFLDSGDGIVFKGAVGPWYDNKKRQFSLSRTAARDLAKMVVGAFTQKTGAPPTEVFFHGRAYFDDEEWRGFTEAVDESKTRVVGVRIRTEPFFRAYRATRHPVLRGLVLVRHPRSALLFTSGYSPRIQTYAGREVPRPLRIDLLNGEADIETVAQDVLTLTKLNYNTCLLGDGSPVTLRFADGIGEILTAGPVPANRPLPFKHYI